MPYKMSTLMSFLKNNTSFTLITQICLLIIYFLIYLAKSIMKLIYIRTLNRSDLKNWNKRPRVID